MTVVEERVAEAGRESTRVSVRTTAERLAEDNAQTLPELRAIYWFPHEEMARLVMVDPVTLPSENGQMMPFYFGPFPDGGIDHPYAIALIRPEELAVLSPPPDWGNWLEAVQLWPKQ